MNKTVINLITIVVLSTVAYFVFVNVFDWTQKKAAIIAFGAAGAMIVMDLIVAPLIKRKKS